MFKRFIGALICAFIYVVPVHAAEITIGFPGPLTGPLGFLGDHMKWAASLAVDEINASGGVLGGKKLKYIARDSKCSPANSVAAVERLVSQDKVNALMGDVCSGATLADMPIVERAKIPMVVTISSHPSISEKSGVGGNVWVFRTSPTDAIIGAIGAHAMLDSGIKSVAFVGEDTDYGRGGVDSVKAVLGDKLKIISTDFLPAKSTDFLNVLTRLRSQKPDAIAIYLLDRQLLNFMKQYVQFDLKIPLVGRPPLGSKLVADLIKTGKFDGSWTVFQYVDTYDSPENIAFVTAYKKKFGQPPHFAGFATYEGVKIIAQAIEQAGSAEPAKIRDALAKIKYNSLLGTVSFDQNHQAHNSILKLKITGDTLKVVGVVGQ
jgi:branched-chain amino acid transport system substrate-binding protein